MSTRRGNSNEYPRHVFMEKCGKLSNTLLTCFTAFRRRRRRPHFQTWISLKRVGQSWSNFMCSIAGVGERLHKVLGWIGSKLWFPWQQKAPIDLQWRKRCLHLFSVVFDPILFILAGNKDMHKISDKFEFRRDWTTDYGVSCPWAS